MTEIAVVLLFAYYTCKPFKFDFSSPFSALVWGSSVKHNPQKVGKDHTLEDEDVIQIVKK